MTMLRSMVERAANPTHILVDAVAMPLRARGTALRSRVVSDLLQRVVAAGRMGLMQLRHHPIGNCGKAPCAGC